MKILSTDFPTPAGSKITYKQLILNNEKNIPLLRCYMAVFIAAGIFCCPDIQAQNPKGVMTIKAGVALTITGGSYLTTNTDINNKGTLTNAGSLVLNGTSAQNFPGAGSISLMNTLEVRNTGAGVLLNNGLKIAKELKLTTGTFALGNYDVSIKSDQAQTAAISAIGPGADVSYGTGRFIIERFVNVGPAGHGKSWEFLSVPANGNSIRNCWQESGAALAGYGTQLTNPLGVGAGYDFTTSTTSIKTYISATANFDGGPTNTNVLIDNPKGYMLYVRGDRTVGTGAVTSPTVLRIKGTIFTPNTPPASIVVNSNKSESAGNPYASQIDFTQLVKTGGLDDKFYPWDPRLNGLHGIGGYQTISATNGWVPVPGGSGYTGVHKTIESGQAFLIHSTGSSGTLSFSEGAKTNGSILVNRDAITTNRQFIRSSLYTNGNVLVDGNAEVFDTDLNNSVDGQDAIKIMNVGENFGLLRDNTILSVEGRNALNETDTIFYYMNNLQPPGYKILTAPMNVDPGRQAFFIDNYLQTSTPLSLSDSSFITFTITADPLSAQPNRFMIVIKPQTVLAVSGISMQAIANNDLTTTVTWQNMSETMVDRYIIEKSTDGISFMDIGADSAKFNNHEFIAYTFKDVLPVRTKTFYRIKIIAIGGSVRYSERAVVSPVQSVSDFYVSPNPVVNKVAHLFFSSRVTGSYELSLFDTGGQTVWNGKIRLRNSSGNYNINLSQNLLPGVYHLMVNDPNGKSFNCSLIIL